MVVVRIERQIAFLPTVKAMATIPRIAKGRSVQPRYPATVAFADEEVRMEAVGNLERFRARVAGDKRELQF